MKESPIFGEQSDEIYKETDRQYSLEYLAEDIFPHTNGIALCIDDFQSKAHFTYVNCIEYQGNEKAYRWSLRG